jgi:16S rRNA (cytidine1402-2'-O)-methyltransferase
MKNGILYIVATPIGNLGDITLRALETLEKVDIIACEDTRVTSKLLNHYSIKKPLVSYHQHSRITKVDYLIGELKDGKNIALVTDAGTPGISDPGNMLIAKLLNCQIAVIPIPGSSSLTALASAAGIDMQKFVYFGFPPHKKGRETFFKEVANFKIPVIYFESPHRVIKNLELLSVIASEAKQSRDCHGLRPRKDTHVIIGRELTKMFEEIIRGNVEEVLGYFEKNPGKIKGEFVIIVY